MPTTDTNNVSTKTKKKCEPERTDLFFKFFVKGRINEPFTDPEYLIDHEYAKKIQKLVKAKGKKRKAKK